LALLPQDFCFIERVRTPSGLGARLFPELPDLTQDQLDFAHVLSRSAPIAYVTTDYFGGMGSQAAAVWSQGELVLPPVETDEKAVLLDGALNRALRLLGVRVQTGALDEFDALGLGTFRSNPEFFD